MYDELPSLEAQTSSEVFAKHLNILNSARREFISSDASIRIKRALSKKLVRFKMNYKTGDLVYYKRQNSDRWDDRGTQSTEEALVGLDTEG